MIPVRSAARVITAKPTASSSNVEEPDLELKPLFDTAPETEIMPEGWTYNNAETLCRVHQSRRGEDLEPVFLGKLEVTETTEDAFTSVSGLQVRFKNRQRWVTVDAPRSVLATSKGALEVLSGRGAPIHQETGAKVARFLTEYAAANEERIPHTVTASRYGFTSVGALVIPAGSVSTSDMPEIIRFVPMNGTPAAKVGGNPEAYRHALENILGWGAGAWVILAALGFALLSPFLERLNPRRNPVLYFAGDSGAGKTTAARFAVSAWGTGAPLEMELGRTTKAGILQTLEGLGGLPLLGDEAHTAPEKAELEGTLYQFANGQSYTRGGKDGKAQGGQLLHGALLLAGEALPNLANAGSHRRLLFLPVSEYPPMAAPVGSSLGAERARMLEDAWGVGAGLCGETFAKGVLTDWAAFKSSVEENRAVFSSLAPWDVPLAAMLSSIKLLCKLYGLEIPEDVEAALIGKPPEVLAGSRLEHEPAVTAWDTFSTLLAGAKTYTNGVGEPEFKEIRGERIAWRRNGDLWHVMHSAPVICQTMGAPRWIERYGSEWVRRGWLRPGKEGKAYKQAKPPGEDRPVWVLILEPFKTSPQEG